MASQMPHKLTKPYTPQKQHGREALRSPLAKSLLELDGVREVTGQQSGTLPSSRQWYAPCLAAHWNILVYIEHMLCEFVPTLPTAKID